MNYKNTSYVTSCHRPNYA